MFATIRLKSTMERFAEQLVGCTIRILGSKWFDRFCIAFCLIVIGWLAGYLQFRMQIG
jgi:hypothetical protein